MNSNFVNAIFGICSIIRIEIACGAGERIVQDGTVIEGPALETRRREQAKRERRDRIVAIEVGGDVHRIEDPLERIGRRGGGD